MARIVYSGRANRDLKRLHDFMLDQAGSAVATRAVRSILEAVEFLDRHPQVGRPVEHGLRELVISYGKTGYLALYRFDLKVDEVRILALRHQREEDYH